MCLPLVIVVYLLFGAVCGTLDERKYNFSYADLASCKEYDTKLGYRYHDYFAIQNIRDPRFPDDVLRVNLFILAAKDAHILLSPTNQQDQPSAVYEIVIGAGSNTFVEIRRQRQTQPLNTIRVKNILSPINPLPLTIRITVGGLIDVRITGQSDSLINATDKDPLAIKYMSFSSWGNTEGKWFYDCAADKGDRLDEASIRDRSFMQIFEEALSAEYDANMMPSGLRQIGWAFKLRYADFDGKKSQMTTRGKFKADWIDPKLLWNPEKTKNVDSVYVQAAAGKIWTPQIRLLNGVSNDFKSINLQFSAKINASGRVVAETQDVTFTTWCNGTDRNWPFEKVLCTINMVFDDYTGLEFTPDSFNETVNQTTNEDFNYDEAHYHIVDVQKYPSAKKRFFDKENNEWISEYSQFVFAVSMEQNGSFYTHLFVTPLFGASVFILLSLWTERYLRVTLNAIGLLITIAMHILLADYGPNDHVPLLVVYYNCILVGAWLSICLFIVNCCIKQFAGEVQQCSAVLKLSWLRLMLGMDVSSSYEYKDLHVEPSLNDDLRKFIDRIAFAIFSFIFAVFMTIGY